jgi:hypothetical protein
VTHAGLGAHPTIDEVCSHLDAGAVLVVGLPMAVAVGEMMKAGRLISKDNMKLKRRAWRKSYSAPQE